MLPYELVNLILEYKLHKHLLPYDNIVLFNKCLQELPRAKRKTRANLEYIRYKHYDTPTYGYKPQDRVVYYDYLVDKRVDIVVCSIERF